MFERSCQLLYFFTFAFLRTSIAEYELNCDTTLHGPFSGEITHYDYADDAAAGAGACMIDTEGDIMVGAMNVPDLDELLMCGQCVEITNDIGVKIVIIIVDSCPECHLKHEHNIDLSQPAFELLYPLQRGRVMITWRVVECNVAGNIRYNFKFPTSPGSYWWGLKILDHIHGIRNVSLYPGAEGDDRGWVEYEITVNQNFKKTTGTPRIDFPFHVRITSVYGVTIEDYIEEVATRQSNTIAGAVQFVSVCDSGVHLNVNSTNGTDLGWNSEAAATMYRPIFKLQVIALVISFQHIFG
ncbi:expansin-YoaJ-like [Saccoglossus kowalevskii]|uniref:Expansin-like protein 5-like n=1 Tax=Saccoglossus kowalevskii TaxID=10224 RepID=A0ABM0M8R5_SACKO|nr:PREDICTED: expansin-like protein 5-like [Saccoglossus kowalevskii]